MKKEHCVKVGEVKESGVLEFDNLTITGVDTSGFKNGEKVYCHPTKPGVLIGEKEFRRLTSDTTAVY